MPDVAAARTDPEKEVLAEPADVLQTLPPPPAYNLRVDGLTIAVPPPRQSLPLPIPVSLPRWMTKSTDGDDGPKTIIRDVSLRCDSGEMMAIIGGSGSGKTTLLHALVGRLANLPLTGGSVKYEPALVTIGPHDVAALSARKMKDRIGFVRQNDHLLAHLTVRETLECAAALRLPASISAETRRLVVEQTIQELGLRDAADTVVGGALRKGISGGERRRLSIGCALVTLPSILALDEPTTGLDAFTAFALLQTLSSLARRGRTVLLSLHQPRSDAFALFDRLVVLCRGDVVFAGRREKCLPWFEGMGCVIEGTRSGEEGDEKDEKNSIGEVHTGAGVNPLDWLIDICSIDPRDEGSARRVERLVKGWKENGSNIADERAPKTVQQPTIARTASAPKDDEMLLYAKDEEEEGEVAKKLKRPGMWRQTVVLTKRSMKGVTRDYAQLLGFTCQSIGIAVLLGITFLRLGETPSDIQSLKASQKLSCPTLSYQHAPCYFYLSLIYAIYKFCENDLVVFDRPPLFFPWLFSEYIANLPLHAFSSGLFALILYFLTNMRTEDLARNLFIFIGECVLVQLGTVGFALLAASLQRTYAQASLMANGLSIFFLLNAGYLLLRPPVYVSWIKWISVYYYGFRAVAISQFRGRTFACPGVVGAARNQVGPTLSGSCDGNQVLVGLLIPEDHVVGYYFAGLAGLAIAFPILAGVILSLYKPGGVQYARQIDSPDRGKESAVTSDMDISRQQIDVEVRHLGFTWTKTSYLTRGRAEKQILKDVSAVFPSGKVTAILGPSGAGKSTLLQLLASRRLNPGFGANFAMQGEILFNGRPMDRNSRSQVAFVEQEDDYHLPALTVRETLRYAAILRLPRNMTRKHKIARAEEVMKMLGLDVCADNLVGGELLKGISGGEKRRLSLAVQMINDPAILIVDEPTSGLDALTANNVMTALNDIARSGRTVILSIHQPRSDIYVDKLDNIILLVKGGQIAFAGPRDEVEGTFAMAGYPVPPLYNPADWLLDVASVDLRGAREEETKKRVANLVDFWANIQRKNETTDMEKHKEAMDLTKIEGQDKFTPMWIALPLIVERMTRNLWRQQAVFWVRLQQLPFLGVLFLLFYQRLKHGPSGGQDRIGYFQEMTSPVAFVGLLNCIAIFPKDRDLYFHEYRSSAAYSEATFILGFTLVALPLEIMAALLFTVVTNIGAGMQTSARIFFEYAFAIFALQSNGESFGIAFACVTNSLGLSVSLVSTFITIKVLVQLSGLISVSIPTWLSDIAYATTMKYAARVIAVNESIGLQLNCPPETVQSGECLVQNGQQLLDLLGFSNDLRTGRYLGILVALAIAYRVVAWAFLVARVRRG
ncbi:ABC transporter [Ceratobasidium sp. AG-Ba]|nr:ABC transporter [Ceratobasidium sp. AG-Ba]